jgi:hypothetical protein
MGLPLEPREDENNVRAESRKYPRKAVEAAIAFQAAEGPRVDARCRDLSLGGMFIEASPPLPYGAKLRVYLPVPGLDAGVDAIVRWAKPDGMGVQFGVMGARETHALTRLLGA